MTSRRALRSAVATTFVAIRLQSCATEPRPSAKLTVAAATNLTDAFASVGREFQKKTGIEVVFTYGSTAQLAQQINNGAPFDLFAAADTDHVDALVKDRKLDGDSRAVYALGQLALWIPGGERGVVRGLNDLTSEKIRYIAIAQPELAPYGRASLDALKRQGIWETVQSKVVYASSINMAKQMAATGNADAAFTAYSLVLHEQGVVVKVDPRFYSPIQQSLAIVSGSARTEEAQQLRAFLLGEEGLTILAKNGYLSPSAGR